MLNTIRQIILKLFGIKLPVDDDAIAQNSKDVRDYEDITRENFTAIISNTLAILAFGDSEISVTASNQDNETRRTALLDDAARRLWDRIKEFIAIGTGCGMIFTIPYVANGKIYFDTVTKDRAQIDAWQGDDITSIVVMSEIIKKLDVEYKRYTHHKLENGVYRVLQRATRNGEPCPLSEVPQWTDIAEETAIGGVEMLPVGIFKCPASNRRPQALYGVPITYGADATIRKIHTCLKQIDAEFENKGVVIFANQELFDSEKKLSNMYFKLRDYSKLGSAMPIEIFDPAFRETALFAQLLRLFEQLEKEVGCSKGVLTEMSTQGATATEIKRAMLATFNLCDDIHRQTEKYIDAFIYGCDVLANYYALTPPSPYVVNYEWAYSLLEDPESTIRQLKEGYNMKAIRPLDVRRFLFADETQEESQKIVDEISEEDAMSAYPLQIDNMDYNPKEEQAAKA